jgi:hypothetical protein
LDAGSQPGEGVYAVDEFLVYHADVLTDRNGHELDAGLDGNAVATAVGLGVTFKLPRVETYWSLSAGLPAGRASVVTRQPPLSIVRAGIGDLYVQPIKLGWRVGAADIVTGYSFYAPVGGFAPAGSAGLGQGQWTHELSGGGTLFFGKGGMWRASALASIDVHGRKRGIDITRGTTIQIQGGFGVQFLRILNAGIASYALWQVSDDEGADLPPTLRGARDSAYGLGPEVDLTLLPVRARVSVRYEHDVATAARPLGQILVIAFTPLLWRPPTTPSARKAPRPAPQFELDVAPAN